MVLEKKMEAEKSFRLKTAAARSSETMVTYRNTTQRHNPKTFTRKYPILKARCDAGEVYKSPSSLLYNFIHLL